MAYYSIGEHRVQCDGDIWTLPALVGADGGTMERGQILLRVSPDGAACDPYTSGVAEGLPEQLVYPVRLSCSDIRGWGELDGPAYIVGRNNLVPAQVIDWLTAHTPLRVDAPARSAD